METVYESKAFMLREKTGATVESNCGGTEG